MQQLSQTTELAALLSRLKGSEWLCSECLCINLAQRIICERCAKRRWEQLGLTTSETIALARAILTLRGD